MAIDGIRSLSEAIKLYNNPNTSNETKREILSQYPDVVKYVGKDTTKYEISDEDFDLAKEQGTQRAKDTTGYDGHKSYRAVGDAVVDTAANVLGQTVLKKVVSKTAEKVAGKAAEKSATKGIASSIGKNAGFVVGCTLGLAEGIKYMATKPNKEQVDAANELAATELPDGQASLAETQDIMAEAEEEFTELSEEAEEVNEDANDKIDEDKTKFDFYRAQYNALKEKAESGEKLTKEEKALMQKLAPLMEDLSGCISDTQEETSDTVSDLSDDMAEYQDTFDESAEVMADVEGVTDFAAGFDENTKIMCYVEGGTQVVNAAMSGYSAYQAAAFAAGGGPFTSWAWAFAAMGTAGTIMSGAGATEQFKWASEVGNEIDIREQTQELNSQTTDVYDEKLDTYTGQVEMIEDMELEVPEDLEIPEQPNVAAEGTDSADGNNPFGMQPKEEAGEAGARGADGTNGGTGNAGNAGGAGQVSNEQNPSYVNKMGKGSDWSEVMNGNIKRDSDNDIVKDSSGRVVLTQQYAEAITSETGAKEGEFFSKDSIPKILAKVLGAPFDEKMIRDVHSGKKLSSEYAAKIIQTKTGNEKGETTVDNTDKATELAKKVIEFYYPIFSHASTQGWVKG